MLNAFVARLLHPSRILPSPSCNGASFERVRRRVVEEGCELAGAARRGSRVRKLPLALSASGSSSCASSTKTSPSRRAASPAPLEKLLPASMRAQRSRACSIAAALLSLPVLLVVWLLSWLGVRVEWLGT